MKAQNNRLGILMMVAATLVFASQDGLSRHLAGSYNVVMVVTVRYWFFAVFAVWIATRQPGGLAATARSSFPVMQAVRGALLALQICVMVLAFVLLGLVEAHAVFACYPLVVAALSGPVLGETVGWRRWLAIAVGFVGILVILRPGADVFSPASLVALLGAAMFALYGLLTRYVAREDGAMTSFFWTGVMGAAILTPAGLWLWQPMSGPDVLLMGILCITGALGHYLLIRCYEVAEMGAVQPFAYLQLVFASAIGISVFGEVLEWPVAAGAAIVTASGIFTLIREARARRRERKLSGP